MLKTTLSKNPTTPMKKSITQVRYIRYLHLILSQKATSKVLRSMTLATPIVNP